MQICDGCCEHPLVHTARRGVSDQTRAVAKDLILKGLQQQLDSAMNVAATDGCEDD